MKAEESAIVQNMEFLVKELHKEWDRTGDVKASVSIPLEQAGTVHETIKEHILERQKLLEGEDLTFRQSMRKSKECYVLFRLVKKIQKQEARVDLKAMDDGFTILLDKEEYKLFVGMFPEHPR